MSSLGTFLMKHLVQIAAAFTAVGTGLLIWAALAFMNVEPFSIGEYKWWVLIMGIIVVFLSAGYVIDYIFRARKFEHLLDVDKKSEFLKRHPELVERAAALSDRYREELRRKEEHFHIK